MWCWARDAWSAFARGVLYGIAAALPHMQQQKSGHIIDVSSVAGHKVGGNNAVYSATKTAVRVISGPFVAPSHTRPPQRPQALVL